MNHHTIGHFNVGCGHRGETTGRADGAAWTQYDLAFCHHRAVNATSRTQNQGFPGHQIALDLASVTQRQMAMRFDAAFGRAASAEDEVVATHQIDGPRTVGLNCQGVVADRARAAAIKLRLLGQARPTEHRLDPDGATQLAELHGRCMQQSEVAVARDDEALRSGDATAQLAAVLHQYGVAVRPA